MNILRVFRRLYSSREISELISVQSKNESKPVVSTALVTGATQDISRVCIKYLLDNDLKNLVITDIHANEGKRLAIDLSKKYLKTRICFIRADLTKDKQVHDLFRSIQYDFQQCDLIINNSVSHDETKPLKMADVNMACVCNCTDFAIEHMSESNGGKGGTIINVASILALEEVAHTPIFTATKSFIIGLTRSYGLPYCYGRTGIRFMALCPGMTVEELNKFNDQARMELAKFGKQNISFVGQCLMEMIKYGNNGSLWTAERGSVYEMNIPYKMYEKKDSYDVFEQEKVKDTIP